MDQLGPMKALARQFAGRARFAFVYTREAHSPATAEGDYLQDGRPVRQAVDRAERRRGAGLLRAAVEPDRLLLLDGFGAESLFERLFAGTGADNPLVVVGADGRVALVSRWADVDEVGEFLKQLPADRTFPR